MTRGRLARLDLNLIVLKGISPKGVSPFCAQLLSSP